MIINYKPPYESSIAPMTPKAGFAFSPWENVEIHYDWGIFFGGSGSANPGVGREQSGVKKIWI